MELRRTPARRAGLVAVAALLVFGASACSGGTGLVGTPPAATVGDTTFTQDQVDQAVQGSEAAIQKQIDAARDQNAGNAELLQQIEDQAAGVLEPYARGNDTYSTTIASAALTEMITAELYEQAVTEAGGTISDTDRQTATEQLEGDTQSDYLSQGETIRAARRQARAAQIALERRLPADLLAALNGDTSSAEDRLRAVYEREADALGESLCSYVVQTADEQSASAAIARIEDGESPSSVAAELSGPEAAEPGCESLETINQAFPGATTEKGAILGPLNTGSAFVFLVVDHVAGFEDLQEQLVRIALQDWLDERLESVGVHVDPRFGTWDAEALQVVPPQAPGTTTTLPVLDPNAVPAGS